MKSLAVRVLGDFGVDGIEPQAFGSRKARLALQLIALGGGQAVPAGVLIDALWETAPPTRPEDQLAVLIARLRSVLGRDRIEHRDQGYLLHCDWLDATELAVLTREVEARREGGHATGAVAAGAALSLIRGDGPRPLPGEWAQLRQAELERLIGRARLVAATALLEAGDWMAAADAASAAAERDPYDEAALRLLLRAHVMGGRGRQRAVHLRQRQGAAGRRAGHRSLARDDRALHTAILRGEVTTPGPAPAGRAGPGLARQAAPGLVGRADELACLEAVAARARGGAAEVVVVDGEAGIGKTTLLRAWAGVRTAAGDTVLVASCGPLDRSMPLDALLTALAGLLRGLGPEAAADILGADAALLAPLLNLAPGQRLPPMLADNMLGPAVLYSALVRALGRLAERAPLVVVADDAHLARRCPTGCVSPGGKPWRSRPWRRSAPARASRCPPRRPSTSARWTGTRPPSWSAGNWQGADSTSCTTGRRVIRSSSPNWPSRPRARNYPCRWWSRYPRGVTSWAPPGCCCAPRP